MKNVFAMQEFWIRQNMSFLARYWTTATEALARVKGDAENFKEFQIAGKEPHYVEAILSSHKDRLCYSGVLLTYATMEEFLAVLAKEVGRMHDIKILPSDLKDRGVKQYKKFIHDVCSVDPVNLNVDWEFLQNFSIVRNTIIHANGNKSLTSAPNKLDALVAKYPGELSFEHSVKLVISEEYVARCIEKTSESARSINAYLRSRAVMDVPK